MQWDMAGQKSSTIAALKTALDI